MTSSIIVGLEIHVRIVLKERSRSVHSVTLYRNETVRIARSAGDFINCPSKIAFSLCQRLYKSSTGDLPWLEKKRNIWGCIEFE